MNARNVAAWFADTLRVNRWYAAMAGIGVVWELWCVLTDPLRGYRFFYDDHLLALAIAFGAAMAIGMPLRPQIASYATLVLGALWFATMSYETYVWAAGGTLAAIVALAYAMPRRAAAATGVWLAYLALVYVARARELAMSDPFRWTCMLMGACALAACAIGMMIGWQRQVRAAERAQAERLRAEQELERKRRNETIAKNIHDSLTGNLSYIALLAQRELARLESEETDGDGDNKDGNNGKEAADTWRSVERNANDALRGVRRVIGLLDAEDAGTYDGDGEERSFEGIMRIAEPKLADLGIHGKTVILDRSGGGKPDGERREAAYALVEEVYANLMRHCAAGENAYFLRVETTDEGTTIAEANALRSDGPANGDGQGHGYDRDRAARLPESGTGLVRHARAIQRLGGTCDYRADGGEWLLSAFIPAGEG